MNFYKFIPLAIMLVSLDEIETESDEELIVAKVGIDDVSPCSVGMIFFVKLNNTSENDYDVELTPDRCCLKEDVEDCDTLQIVGHCKAHVPRNTVKTLRLVAPTLDPFEREGYCDIYLDSKLNKQRNKRNVVKVNFDTALRNGDSGLINIKRCAHKDEDPLNDCKTVNCEKYYNGQKTYYNKRLERCVAAPSCISSEYADYPEVVYNPVNNKCQKQSIAEDEVNALKGFANYKNGRTTKDIVIIREFQPNGTDFLDIDTTNFDRSSDKKHEFKGKEIAYSRFKSKNSCKSQNNLENNTGTIKVLGLIILVQSVLICFMVYCISKKCGSSPQNTVERKFFNSRNDISITTPLIATSNVDTDAADFHCLSEMSHKDQKIKCYKSCQKEKPENVKISMSDDILLKCLNRRDWKHHNNLENNPEDLRIECLTEKISENVKPYYSYAVPKLVAKESKKSIETRVAFKDETFHSDSNNKNKVLTITNNKDNEANRKQGTNDMTELVKPRTSEKELKCHSYNCFDTNLAGLNLEGLQSVRKSGLFKSNNSKKGSFPTEKGAQAYFSNDSIEDFLSERGGIYLNSENISKYDSNEVKPTSSVSSKTSKNFIKNVLSFLSRRSKQGPLSDPGQTKNVDWQLIHMSKGTIYSSSNDSECVANLNRADSKTSF